MSAVAGTLVALMDNRFEPTLEAVLRHALAFLGELDRSPVDATADLGTLRERLGKRLSQEGVPPGEIIDDLVRDTQGGIVGSTGGRFFAWVIGGALPSALAADWLATAWDQNAGLYAAGPAAAVVEEIAGGWLKNVLCLPEHASFGFVSGCQMAHVTCLAAARHELLARRGWDVERQGLSGAPPIRIFAGSRHGSFDRAVRFLGIGTDQIKSLAVDDQDCLLPEALEQELRNIDGPAVVLLQAGDINTGSYDRFTGVIPIAHRYGAWVHVDGAIGLWASASPRFRHLTEGMAAADSWATDGHKWLNVPYDSGFAFVAHPEAHRAAMSHRASYLTHAEVARDQMDWNPEWSRRARGFAVYAALRELGRHGLAHLIDRCCDRTQQMVDGLAALDGVEVLWRPIINQAMVRFLDPRPGATDHDHDRYTDETINRILAGGEAFFGGTTWRGRRAMRISVCNWRTTTQDVERAVAACASALCGPGRMP